MTSPINHSPIEAMWDTITTASNKKTSTTVHQDTIHLAGQLQPPIPVRLTDKHIFTKKPVDTFANKLSRLLGLKNYVVLKVHQLGGGNDQVGFVKVDSRHLSEQLKIERRVLNAYIEARPDLDLTEFIHTVIENQADQRKTATNPELPSLPARIKSHPPKEPVKTMPSNSSPPPIPPKPPNLLQNPPIPPKPPNLFQNRPQRSLNYQEAVAAVNRMKADRTDPKATEFVLILLSQDIEDWVQNQELSSLNELIAQVQEKIVLYSEPNLRTWTESVRRSRMQALLEMNDSLQDWKAVSEAGGTVKEPGLVLEIRLEQAASSLKAQVKAENKQLLTAFLNTHTLDSVLDPTTGDLDLREVGQENRDAITNLIKIVGANGQNWTEWLRDDSIHVTFANIKAIANADPSKRLEVSKPVSRSQLADQLSSIWAEHKDSGARIGVPVNIGGGHWTLVFIDPKNKTIEWYDSMGNFTANTAKHLENFRQEQGLDFAVVNKAISAPQRDGYQCGVWTSEFLTLRAFDDDFSFDKLPDNPSAYIASARQKFHNEIVIPQFWKYATDLMKTDQSPDALSTEGFLRWLETS